MAVTVSSEGKGRSIDSVIIERLWRTAESEESEVRYLWGYANGHETQRRLAKNCALCNTGSVCETLKHATPGEVSFGGLADAARVAA